jgi:CxxC motif-containing protein (DUF1111 family)
MNKTFLWSPCDACIVGLVVVIPILGISQVRAYPHNATSCEQCHIMSTKFGSSPMTVKRVGFRSVNKFVPGPEGGIEHRHGRNQHSEDMQISAERVALNTLGDGYIEAILDDDLVANAAAQRTSKTGIAGVVVQAPALESSPEHPRMAVGRFGWKSQHSSLLSACADSLRNELGIRNQLYPEEYADHGKSDGPTPLDDPDPKTGKTELERLVDELRHALPPARDENLAEGPDARAGEKLFHEIGCAICHVTTYRTAPAGTLINDGTYRVPDFIGSQQIHPYSDFLLHDVGTGDGIPQAAKPEYLDQSTANMFRTAPLWGVRFRSWMMHDGKSITYHQAIMRHGGEASEVRDRYEALTPVEKQQLHAFLNSL